MGKIDPYLIMPFIEGKSFDDMDISLREQNPRSEEGEAAKEVEDNFYFLLRKHLINQVPQVRAFIYRKNKEGKKPVVFAVYDYI